MEGETKVRRPEDCDNYEDCLDMGRFLCLTCPTKTKDIPMDDLDEG